MKLIPWRRKHQNGSRELASPWSHSPWETSGLFERFLSDPWFEGELLPARTWGPPVDITENEKEVVIRSEIPGVKPEDVDVTVSGDVLTIAGEKKESFERKGENHYHTERRFGSFRRNLRLPAEVDPDRVAAHYEDGILKVTLQKKASAAHKRVPISAGKS